MTAEQSKGLVLFAAVLAVVVSVTWAVRSGGDAPARHAARMTAGSGLDDAATLLADPAWTKAASRAPTRIEYVSEASEGGDGQRAIVQAVETLGPLPPSQKPRLREHLQKTMMATYAQWERECQRPGTGPRGTKTMNDAMKEMNTLLMAMRHQAHLNCLEEDSYVTVEAGTGDSNKVIWPRGYLTSVIFGAASVGERRVDVVFGVAPDDPAVESIHGELAMLRSLAEQEDIEEFNRRPFEDRKRSYERHVAAVAALRELPAEGEGRAAEVRRLVADMVPGSWVFDTSSFFARKRE